MEKQGPSQHNDPETNRENQDHQFPGYPHHPAGEDILNPENEFAKADVDPDTFSRNTWTATRKPGATLVHSSDADDEPAEKLLPDAEDMDEDVLDPEADVTDEDLDLLGDPDLDQDGGDDELLENYQGLDDTDFDGDPLNERTGTLAGSGRDLDLPGDDDPEVGLDEQDEENDYYSLGGDKDSLEDDQAGEIF